MKKTFLACLFLSTLVLASCGNKGAAYNDGFVYSNDTLFDSTLATQNVIEPEYVIRDMPTPCVAVNGDQFYGERIVSQNYRNYGLLVMSNEYGNIGFYSLIASDYVLERQFEPQWLDYHVTTSDNVGFYLTVRYEDKYTVVDSFGNLLYQGEQQPEVSDYLTSFHARVSTVDETKYFKYNKDTGAAMEVDVVIDDTVVPEEEEEYEGPFLNTNYREDWADLTPYGLEDYSLIPSSIGIYHVYHNNEIINHFYLDNTCAPIGIVGQSFYYQQIIQLSEYATDYTYTQGNTKYSLSTHSINLVSGEKKEHGFMAVFNYLVPIKNEEEKVVWYVVDYNIVNSDGALAENYTKVIDHNFGIHEDLSGMAIGAFIKLGNAYFNVQSKMLYDSELEPITWLGNIDNLTYNPYVNMFVGTRDGKYGMVNLNGVVKVEFVFDALYPNYCANGMLIGTIDGEVYRIAPGFNLGTPIGKNVAIRGDNLFSCTTDDGKILYFNTTENLFSYYPTDNISSSSLNVLGNTVYSFWKSEPDNYDYIYTYYRINDQQFEPQSVPSSTKGDEEAYDILSGRDIDDTASISTGYNLGHFCNDYGYVYLKFAPQKTGYYSLYLNSTYTYLDYLFYIAYSEYDDPYQQSVNFDTRSTSLTINEKQYSSRYVALLEEGRTYYCRVYRNDYLRQTFDIYLDLEQGIESSYPLIVNLSENSKTFEFVMPVYEDFVSEVYVKFKAYKLGYYRIVPPTSSAITFYSERYSGGTQYDNSYYFAPNEYGVIRIYKGYSSFESNFTFEFNVTELDIPDGYALSKPINLNYGYNYIYDEYGSFYQQFSGAFSTLYFKFTAPEEGTYRFAVSINSSSYSYSGAGWQFYNSEGTQVNVGNDGTYYLVPKGYSAVYQITINSGYSLSITHLRVYSDQGYSIENPLTYSSSLSFDNCYCHYVKYTASTTEVLTFAVSDSNLHADLECAVAKYNYDAGERILGNFYKMIYDENIDRYVSIALGSLFSDDYVMFHFKASTWSTSNKTVYFYKYDNDTLKSEDIYLDNVYEHVADSGSNYYTYWLFVNDTGDSLTVYFDVENTVYPAGFILSKYGFVDNVPTTTLYPGSISDNSITIGSHERVYVTLKSSSSFSFHIYA